MKRAISFMLTLAMALSVAVTNPAQVGAATKYDLSNVTDLGTGKTYTETWTNKHHKEAYFSFELKKKGYASFTLTKPVISGITADQRVAVLDKNGKEVWVSKTDRADALRATKTSFKVGLNKGKYYLCIQPLSMTVMSWESGTTKVTLSTKADSYFETEANGSKKTANTIKLGKTYKGVFCDEYDPTGNSISSGEDWYKIKLTKNKTYKFTLKSKKPLGKSPRTTIVEILDSKQKADTAKLGRTLRDKGSVKFKAKKTGYYYIRMWNDGQHTGVEYSLKVKKVK